MTDALAIIDQAPLQDRDLLQRLSVYFDGFHHRLRQGQGWFIFNAPGTRASRITTFIQYRLADYRPEVSSCIIPWRDFAINAYIKEVGLSELSPEVETPIPDPRVKQEYEIAVQVTREACNEMSYSDVLVLSGLKPSHEHEAIFLDHMLEERYQQKLATILLTPDMPKELEAEFESLDPSRGVWERLFQRMYETSLVAL
jgi:hypothetical protein